MLRDFGSGAGLQGTIKRYLGNDQTNAVTM